MSIQLSDLVRVQEELRIQEELMSVQEKLTRAELDCATRSFIDHLVVQNIIDNRTCKSEYSSQRDEWKELYGRLAASLSNLTLEQRNG